MERPTRSPLSVVLPWAPGVLVAGLLCLCATGRNGAVTPGSAPPAAEMFRMSYENVLGTSMDLTVLAPGRQDAERCEQAVFEEIGRLETIFSTYDSRSEISRLNDAPWCSGDVRPVSGELHQFLTVCTDWRERTHGALDVYLGELIDLWHRAAREGRLPSPATTADVVARLQRGGFRTGVRDGEPVVERLGPGRFHVDAVAKGLLIERAVAAARQAVPSLRGILLDIGGDLRAWGSSDAVRAAAWEVGIADPGRPADNAPPLARVRLADRAIATSGGYDRFVTIDGRRYGHILDPRTGLPAGHVLSATAVARDAATADALATALCVLLPSDGLALVDGTDDAACLLVDWNGLLHRSRGWKAIEVADAAAAAAPADAWPNGNRFTVRFDLIDSTSRDPSGRRPKKFKRHYMAAWVEDAKDQPVRLLALWAERKEFKYVRDLTSFWQRKQDLGGEDRLMAVSRATRPTGTYTLTWDGRDKDGKPVPAGTYSVHIDINREDGPPRGRAEHTHTAVSIAVGDAPASAAGQDKPELGNVKVTYGPQAPEPGSENKP